MGMALRNTLCLKLVSMSDTLLHQSQCTTLVLNLRACLVHMLQLPYTCLSLQVT